MEILLKACTVSEHSQILVRAIFCISAFGFMLNAGLANEKAVKTPPALYATLSACRTITNDTERLICFDTAAATVMTKGMTIKSHSLIQRLNWHVKTPMAG
jgi:hypothetical protein